MKLNVRERQAMKHCIRHRMLDPIPEMIRWHRDSVIMHRPPTKLRKNDVYIAWKAEHEGKLPEWVRKLDDAGLFYNKICALTDLIAELDICQTLPLFIKGYLDGIGQQVRGNQTESSSSQEISGDNSEPADPGDAADAVMASESMGAESGSDPDASAGDTTDDLLASLV